ncbi:MAG: cupredoxin domain-containing protein [Nitrososphaerota archaeon]|nr:cupredoxin domain-containing protein [Nitrososphaerota archaeon]
MSTQSPQGSKGSVAVGAVVAILIIGAVATLGYYQFAVAGNQSSTTATSSTLSVSCPSSACTNVTIVSGASSPPPGYATGQKTTYGYAPDTITVTIGKDNTVFWTNGDSAAHTVTSDTGAFNSGNMNSGDTYQFTFTTPGTYTYHCSYHPYMQGTVIVEAGSGSNSTTTSGTSTGATST